MTRRRTLIVLLIISVILFASINTLAMISSEDRQDKHVSNFGFKVEITGSSGDSYEGKWKTVRHSGISFDETPGATGGKGKALGTRDPADIDWGKLTLSGPVLGSDDRADLLDWYKLMIEGGNAEDIYKDVKITLLGPDGSEKRTYEFHECFLSSYSMSPLDADDDSELEEAIEITIGYVDEYPVKERKDNKGKSVSSMAHALNRPLYGMSELGPLGVFLSSNCKFAFSFDDEEISVSRIEPGAVHFELDLAAGTVKPVFDDWVLYQPVDAEGLTLEEIWNDFQSGVRTPESTSGSLELLDDNNETKRSFELFEVMPTRFDTIKINSSSGESSVKWALEVRVNRIEMG